MQGITLGGGCFWCTEAIFRLVAGVTSITSGYMGGELKHPTYMEISNGDTGHVEVVQIFFDEEVISLEKLLLIFFKTHNPTALNKQDNNIGTQYRSVIFYHTDFQKVAAEEMIATLTEQQSFSKPILTDVKPASKFYEAEDYHQEYFSNNHHKPFCNFVIQPKLNAFCEEFGDSIKLAASHKSAI